MAKAKEKVMTAAEKLAEMRTKGTEQKLPGTERMIRLRTLEAPELLREGKLPDILTPLVIKSVYQELTDKEVREFLSVQRSNAAEALKMIDAMDFVVAKSIADGTNVSDLTLAEKRWIFRLAMGPAELLITFRYDPNDDVEPVAEGEDIPSTSE
jgi:hypothetical protein